MMVAGLAGCGGNQPQSSQAPQGQSAKIGFITAYTGPGAAYGQAMKDGVDLAVEEINKDPNTKVKIDLKTYGFDVDLSSGIDLIFDAQGNFVRVDK